VVVTGASRGIGAVVARRLAELGARLALVGRDRRALDDLALSLAGDAHDQVVLDVADESGWTSAAERLAPDGVVHGIVTAAGELGPIGPIGSWSVADFRRTLDVNLVGTLLPIVTLLEPLGAGGGSVVTFSGGGATGAFPRFDAYATSKVAVARLTENLAAELGPRGIRLNCVAPGFILTNMHNATLAAGPELVGADYYQRTRSAMESGGGDPAHLAADLAAFLLSDDSRTITGRLISARWDPWRDEAFRDRLGREPDLATLRRIDDQFFVPAPDRVP
jgi:3-oxoacyl-[acyl-carrier protein] reductase